MSWLTGWTYRKATTLSRASGAVTNYQMKLFVGESASASGEDIDCQAKCRSDFADLRFTAADGITLLDYWIESVSGVTPNQLATVWIEFDYIGTGATTFYMYYGNAGASSLSNGANTFLLFDDFEWGSNGDNLTTSGGSVTWTAQQGVASISTAKAYTGTRSARFNGAATYPAYTAPFPLAENIAFSVRFYKETATTNAPNILFGNNSKFVNMWVWSDEVIHTTQGSTSIYCSADIWQQVELYNFNLSTFTFSLSLNGGASIANGRTMANDGSHSYLRFLNADSVDGRELWIDHVFIRQWLSTGPAWGGWGSESVETIGWLEGWTYRKGVTLSRSSGVVTNYQMKVLVGESPGASGEDVDCGGFCQTDFDDLRFTTHDGETLLDYWIESVSGVTPNQLATVWIEFDYIWTGATTFYMYFGNSGAAAYSNGPNTFILFEDFNALVNGDLNGQNGWSGSVLFDVQTSVKQEGAKALSISGGTQVAISKSMAVNSYNCIIQMYMRATETGDTNPLEFYLMQGSTQITGITITLGYLASLINSGWSNLASASDNTWYKVKLTLESASGHKVWINDALITPSARSNLNNVSSSVNVLRLEQWVSTANPAYFDLIFVGNYLATGPAWGAWGMAEALPEGPDEDETPWLEGWSYRKRVKFARPSGVITNYQVKLLIGESSGASGEDVDCGGFCQTDFDDLRFTNADGTTLLDYWIESVSGVTPNQLATVWIELDSVGVALTTFYIYYGNPEAVAASNGENTFLFFDHFPGSSLDTAIKWDISAGSVAVSNSLATPGQSSGARSKSSWTYPYAIRSRIQLDNPNNQYAGLCWDNGSGVDNGADQCALSSGNGSSHYGNTRKSWTWGSTVNLSSTTYEYCVYDLIRHTSGTRFQIIRDGVSVWDRDDGSKVPTAALKIWMWRSYGSLNFDWVLVRNYQTTGIEFVIWGAEQEAPSITGSPYYYYQMFSRRR